VLAIVVRSPTLLQGGSAAATEVLWWGTALEVARLEDRVRASVPEPCWLRGIGGRMRLK
jgi:hypothetical protein